MGAVSHFVRGCGHYAEKMLDVRVLGPIEARDGDEVIVLGSRAQRALVAALVHARGRAVATSELAILIWGGTPPAHPEDALKSHVSRLRRALRDDVIAARPPGYALAVSQEQCDVHRFERGLDRSSTVGEIDTALGLWRGRPYGEFADHEHFVGEVARLTELHVQGRLRRARLLLAVDHHEAAIAAFTQLVAEEPLAEAAWVGLLRSLHAAGRQAEATAKARRYRELVRDAGLDPSPDFLGAEREVFMTVPRATRAHGGPRALPGRLSSIVGRRRELAELDELVRRRRLVTLVGPGGVGKTTLAEQVARWVADDLPDGAFIVSLADVADASSVVPAIVRAVGAPAAEPLDRSLEHYLSGQRALVVIDNAEHVRSAVRSITSRVLAASGALHLLVTSRQPLAASGEVIMSLPPLGREAAITLFRERAQEAGAPIRAGQQDLAIEVCDRLDRLPLAIEMAAARLRGLGLGDLAARLDECLRLLRTGDAGRHETLEAVVGWSYDLLDVTRRSLLDQLSVFAGSFDLEAAEAVWDGADVAGGVADLVERSLVQRVAVDGPARFRLFETVRSFAAERLAGSEASAACIDRFVSYHVAFAKRVGEGLRGPDERVWVEALEWRLVNLEIAHAHALETDDVDAAVELVSSLHLFVYHRLRADVGAWAEATLPSARRASHPGVPAVAAVVALNRLHRGEFDGAEALLVDLPDDPVARHAHEILGDLHLYRGRFDASYEHFRHAERLARQVDDRFTALHSRMSQGMALGYAGRIDEGLAIVEEVRREGAAARIEVVTGWCDFTVAELLSDSQPRRALELVDRAVDRADRAGWRMLAGVGRLTASSLRARTAEPADAIPGFERLIRHWDRIGDETHQWTTLRNLVELFTRLDAYAPAARLLGAVSTGARPTFGAEQQRLEEARESVRRHLGGEAHELMMLGRDDGLAGAVELSLASLKDLRETHPVPPESP